MAFDELPQDIIGKIASYLAIDEYITFQTANKFIYTECNSLSHIVSNVSFRMPWVKYFLTNCSKYSMLKILHLTFSNIINLIIPFDDTLYFKNLIELSVDFEMKTISEHQIYQFRGLKCIKLSSIKILKCNLLGHSKNLANPETFIRFLCLFRNVEHLEFFCVGLSKNLLYDTPQFPKLKCLKLSFWDDVFQNKFLKKHSNQLEILNCSQLTCSKLNGCKFSKLEQLAIYNVDDSESIDYIINSTDLLRKICFKYRGWGSKRVQNIISANQFSKLLTKQNHLEYISICYDSIDMLKYAAQCIVTALNEFKKMKLTKPKLKMEFRKCHEGSETETIIWSVKKLIETLDGCDINDFMLVYRVYQWSPYDKSRVKELYDKSIDIFKDKFVNYHIEDETFVISKLNSHFTWGEINSNLFNFE